MAELKQQLSWEVTHLCSCMSAHPTPSAREPRQDCHVEESRSCTGADCKTNPCYPDPRFAQLMCLKLGLDG